MIRKSRGAILKARIDRLEEHPQSEVRKLARSARRYMSYATARFDQDLFNGIAEIDYQETIEEVEEDLTRLADHDNWREDSGSYTWSPFYGNDFDPVPIVRKVIEKLRSLY